MSTLGCRVWKLGGSLLSLPDLRLRLLGLLGSVDSSVHELIVVGGGKAIDAFRELNAVHHFDDSFVHWRCVDLLSITAQLLTQVLPEFELIQSPDELQSLLGSENRRHAIVDVRSFYAPGETSLPENWSTTTDSIAALLTHRIGAELVLLKSCSRPSGSWKTAASAGFVDDHFPAMASKLNQVQAVNLREVAPVQ
jgi:aspartokinase-like uncharacterized kinase